MTWPFENDTSAITKKLAKKSLQSEKRRNLMVVIAVALAAFLICFTGIVSTSLTQMQRNQVVDTYEAVWLGVEENDIETLKGLPEFERVGGYYMLGEELSEQGYHASYVYCDAQMPLRYNNDKQKKPLFSRGLSVCRLLFNSFSKLKIDENYKEKRRLFY